MLSDLSARNSAAPSHRAYFGKGLWREGLLAGRPFRPGCRGDGLHYCHHLLIAVPSQGSSPVGLEKACGTGGSYLLVTEVAFLARTRSQEDFLA